MKLATFFVVLANVVTVTKVAASQLKPPVKNRDHTCFGPKDCVIKCEDGIYYRHRNPASGLETLRCRGTNSDYTYVYAQCLHAGEGVLNVLHHGNTKACKLVGGLLCTPNDVEPIKKSVRNRCILDPVHLREWKHICVQSFHNALAEVKLKDVPYTCHPDYLP